jgi:hypothetical protein
VDVDVAVVQLVTVVVSLRPAWLAVRTIMGSLIGASCLRDIGTRHREMAAGLPA